MVSSPCAAKYVGLFAFWEDQERRTIDDTRKTERN